MLKHDIKKFIFVSFLILLSLCFKACGGGNSGSSGNGGVGGGNGDRAGYSGPEQSALSGAKETAGLFNISADEYSAAVFVASLSDAPLVSLSGSNAADGSGVTFTITITNASPTDMTGVALRAVEIGSSVSMSNADGVWVFGDIPAGASLTRSDITFSGAWPGFTFKAYITQYKSPAPPAVVEPGASGAGASFAGVFAPSRDMARGAGVGKAAAGAGAITQGAQTSVKTDSSGNPKISYLLPSSYDLKYASWDGAAWSTVVVDDYGDTGYYSSLALSNAGNPRISYYYANNPSSGRTGDLKYAYCNTGAACLTTPADWTVVTIDSTGDTGGYTSIALDSSGNPRIAYYDFTNMNLNYIFCDSNCDIAGNWTKVVVDSSGAVGEWASLALDPTTYMPRISYYDRTPPTGQGSLKYASCDSSCGNSANWTKVEVANTSGITDPGGAGLYSSLALEPGSGYPRIAGYSEYTGTPNIWYQGASSSSVYPNLGPRVWVKNSTATSGNASYGMYVLPIAGGYRLYYGLNTFCCSPNSGELAYNDTTDANLPTDGNLGTRQFLNVGRSDVSGGTKNNYVYSLDIVPITGGYRMYYNKYDGTVQKIYYRDTTNANPPGCAGSAAQCASTADTGAATYSNLGAETLLINSTNGTTDQSGTGPKVLQLPTGYWRIYYSYRGADTFQKVTYQDTNDFNPPSSSNLNATKYTLPNFDSSNQGVNPEVVQLSSGKYRLYYSFNGVQTKYMDTTDTNPPNTGNMSATITTLSTGYVGHPFMVARPGGGYRYYFQLSIPRPSATTPYASTYYKDTILPEEITRTEDTVIFTGSAVDTSSSGGYVKEFPASSTSTTFTFTGTAVSVIAKRGSTYCTNVNVYVDSVLQTEASNFYTSGSTLYQQEIWATSGLSYGSHTIYLSSGAGCTFNIDAFDVYDESMRDSEYPYSTTGTSGTSTGWTRIRVELRPDSGGYGYDTSTGLFTSLAISTAGKYVISYYYYGNMDTTYGSMLSLAGDLKYAYCSNAADCTGKPGDDNDGISWNAEDWTNITLDSTNDTGWFTSSVFTTSGRVYTTYYDSTTGDLKIYTCSAYNTCP